MAINYQKRQKIIAQALNELRFAREFKQGKIKTWQVNEDLYYGRKPKSLDSRANVDLGQMSSFVHTLLAKIDNPITFKFVKQKDSQLKRVKQLNRLKAIDQERDFWDIKDIAGKKQAIIYGRSIYSYHADSIDGVYKPHLENVDVYDFLVDPAGGGLDLEKSFYLGRYGVVKQKWELEAGVKSGIYLRTETGYLIDGSGNSTDINQEETNKMNRTYDQRVWNSQKNVQNPDKYVFWEWYTTFEGERYYLLLNDRGGTAIRVEKLSDIFESDMWPFWTWAAFPDLTEFWTPSYCDYVREIFMAQAVSINQMLDNAEQINKPQKVVNVGAIENFAELKYRREGYIKVRNEFDANKAVQILQTPSINTPIQVFQLLDGIQEKASGVTAGAKGVSDEDKVGIYEGNQANAADRFGFLNKSYAFGYKRMAKLWEAGVREHLIKRMAIDILGPDGVEIEEVNRRDLFRKGEQYLSMVESSTAETALSEVEKRTKLAFLQSQAANPLQNKQKAYEIQALIAGFDEDTIRQLQDATEYGDANLMSEAERDIEDILDGKKMKPNQAANNAYKQRFVDYMRDNQEDITEDQFQALAMYVDSLQPIIIRNMVRQGNEQLMKEQFNALKNPTGEVAPQTEDINKVETINGI